MRFKKEKVGKKRPKELCKIHMSFLQVLGQLGFQTDPVIWNYSIPSHAKKEE